MEHSSNSLYYASKGGGCYRWQNGTEVQLNYPARDDLALAKIYVDKTYDKAFELTVIKELFLDKLKGLEVEDGGASCVHHMDLLQKSAQISLECTRKGNWKQRLLMECIKKLVMLFTLMEWKLVSKSILESLIICLSLQQGVLD